MKKTNSLIALFVVWGLVLVSAVALGYILQSPVPVATSEPPPRALAEPAAKLVSRAPVPAVGEPTVYVLPDTIIYGRAPPAVVAKPHELRCAKWTNLSQGPAGAQVRYCE